MLTHTHTLSYRLGEAPVLAAALHVEGLDLDREATEQDGCVDGVCHHPLRSLGDVLKPDGRKATFQTVKVSNGVGKNKFEGQRCSQ